MPLRLVPLALLLVATAAPAVDLEGTWHVLVHYKDAATRKPDQERWEDRLWVFERKGAKLQWTEYPIVVFSNQSGRFERLGTNRASRVLHYWEPNAAQRAEIARGLEFNTRGSKTKGLRGSDAGGWSSARGGGGYQSSRFITYTETWSIEGLPDRPSFRRRDSLGSASAEGFAGTTLYEAETATDDVIEGRFQRDGTRTGRFRLTRSGAASVVKGSSKSLNERATEAFASQMGSQLFAEDFAGEGGEAALRKRIEAGTVTEEDRRAVRQRLEDTIAEEYRAQGNDPRAYRPQVERLAREMERLYLDEGKSVEEIRAMILRGELRP